MTTSNPEIFNTGNLIADSGMSAKELAVLDKALNRTKLQLFYEANAGFLTALIAKMTFVWSREIPTACTNGVFMAWNPEFFLSLPEKTRVTVLAHEGWHVAFQHIERLGDRDIEDYNSAADYIINNMLKASGYTMDGFPFLLNDKYIGLSTEEVYELIKGQKIQNPQNGDFTSQGSESMSGGMTPEEIKTRAKNNIRSAATIAKMSGEDLGNLPSEVQEILNSFLSPKLPWREILLNFFEALTTTERSYARPHRRYLDPILPGDTGRNGLSHIAYFLDVSGSIADKEIVRFNSEVKHIKDNYNPEKLTLILFDTKIQSITDIEEEEEFEQITIQGRGGTDLTEVYAWIHEHNPNAAIIFTDLHVRIPQKKPSCPLVWIVSGNQQATAPYGTLIHIDEEK